MKRNVDVNELIILAEQGDKKAQIRKKRIIVISIN